MPTIVVPIATGFEEIEAMSIIDILNRAGIEVVVAGVNTTTPSGANTSLKVNTPKSIEEVKDEDFDMVVLPGGLPGSENLAKSEVVKEILRKMDEKGKRVGAICAAPWALAEAGVIKKEYTCYPSFEKVINKDGYNDSKDVVIDGNVLTSKGPGTAMKFALEIVKELVGVEKYNELKEKLLFKDC